MRSRRGCILLTGQMVVRLPSTSSCIQAQATHRASATLGRKAQRPSKMHCPNVFHGNLKCRQHQQHIDLRNPSP